MPFTEVSLTMPDPGHELTALEESIRRDAERVEELERQKAGLDPAHPHVADASRKVEQIAAELKEKAAAERQLTDEG